MNLSPVTRVEASDLFRIVLGSRLNQIGTAGQEFPNFLDHPILLFGGEMGIHGQGHNFFRQMLCDRKISFFVSAVPVSTLKMKGNGIMDPCPYTIFCEARHQLVSVMHPDYVQMVDRLGPWSLDTNAQAFPNVYK